jgi:glutathione S-transferase
MLTLYMHPLASYCWKVLLPLYETATPFTAKHIDLADPAQKAELLRVSAFARFPVLVDGDKIVGESAIIIEHLNLAPTSLEARARDRFFDAHVMDPMGRIVREKLQSHDLPAADLEMLATAYRLVEDFIDELGGDTLTIADCAAIPSLFYADYIVPIEGPKTRAYLDRMLARPSMQRIREEAAPYWQHFPFATARSGARGAT